MHEPNIIIQANSEWICPIDESHCLEYLVLEILIWITSLVFRFYLEYLYQQWVKCISHYVVPVHPSSRISTMVCRHFSSKFSILIESFSNNNSFPNRLCWSLSWLSLRHCHTFHPNNYTFHSLPVVFYGLPLSYIIKRYL